MQKINIKPTSLYIIIHILFFLSFGNSLSFSQESWFKNFGGTGDDKAYAVTVDKTGSIYITGYTTQSGGNIDIVTLKYNQSGTLLWSKTFDGTGHSDDKAYAITIDRLNNVIVTGYTTGIGSHHDYITIKYNTSGTQQWIAPYNAPFNNDDEAHSVICDDSSNVYVTGFITNFGTYYYTIKYNAAGTYQWGKTFGGTGNGDNKAYAITLDKQANIYVTGSVFDTATGYDFATIKYNLNGDQLWAKIFNGTGNGEDKAYAITIDKLGFIYVTGYALDTNNSVNSFDFTTLKYDSLGSQIWKAIYNGTGNNQDKAYAITLDSLNNAYITGSSRNDTTAGSEDFVTIKYNSVSGDSLWVSRYTSPGDGPSIPYSISIPKNNPAVFVTGSSWTDSTNKMDIATVKYNINTGDTLQKKRINGSGNNDDVALMVTSDTTGNIFIAGYEAILNNGNDMFVAKYPLGDLIAVRSISTNLPSDFKLFQNYPNPFNPSTKIKFELPKSSVVKLIIYDLLGKEVETLINKYLHFGTYEVEFKPSELSTGVYFYELSSENFRDVKKMVLIK